MGRRLTTALMPGSRTWSSGGGIYSPPWLRPLGASVPEQAARVSSWNLTEASANLAPKKSLFFVSAALRAGVPGG